MIPRTTSSVIFFAIFLFGLFSANPYAGLLILGIVLGATALGTHEYYNMARKLSMRPSPWPGKYIISLGFIIDAYFYQFSHFVHIFIACFWLLLITQVFFKRHDRAISNTAVSLFGSIYVGLPLAILLFIFQYPQTWGYSIPHAGSYLIVFLVLTCWATDIGGYLIGKPLGKHKLCPTLSPNKSVEGLIGGILLAIIFGVLLKALWPGMSRVVSWPEAILLPIAFSILGLVGDLAESAFKRDAQVKDSGRTYTGHGGMLDIIDSLLLCAPAFYLYLEMA